MARFTLDLPDDLNDWLTIQADTAGLSKNQLIAQLLTQQQRLSDVDRNFDLALDTLHQFEQTVRADSKNKMGMREERWGP